MQTLSTTLSNAHDFVQELHTTSAPAIATRSRPARDVYFDLFHGQAGHGEMEKANHFLSGQLANAARLDSDLPEEMDALFDWMQAGVEDVGHRYRQYLDARQAGGERRYFRNRSHALFFLKSVAPTKMVDGAWLYGLLPRWQDTRFTALIQTYLEELGEGVATKNHVVLYKKLLASHGCERWDDLSDDHYVQGAIQLSLAYHAERFLPEVIGFNLGYEQLPLHLLITAYELKELGIDPYYFTLHITVDNADSGHAKKAVDAIFEAMPRVGDPKDFYRRVQNGYKLNFLGESTNSVIESFDLQREMEEIFSRKGTIGQYAHSDYRRVAGRTINEWLSNPTEVGGLIAAMEESGWFARHQDPQNSRFWKLIQSEKAKMFGVFSAYEQQVIYDWIAGDAAQDLNFKWKPIERARPQLSIETKQRFFHASDTQPAKTIGNGKALEIQPPQRTSGDTDNDFDAEVRLLDESLASAANPEQAMSTLIALMSPTNHHTAPGLAATRIFNEIMG